MAKKFQIEDFDQTPGKVKDQRTSNYFSFYKSPNKKQDLLKLPCDLHIADITNLDIIKDRGRSEGSQVLYDADQIYNYLSQSERYEKAIGIQPSSIKQEDKKTIYQFCSSRSPSGMWEVVIDESGKATFIYFEKVFLVIIVPRRFKLSEVTKLVTDSLSVSWTQIKGNRDVFIETGTSFDPILQYSNSCLGEYCKDTKELEPIILRVESDNPLLFADLVIQNRLIDNWYGLSYSANSLDELICRKVDIKRLEFVPLYNQKAYIWQGEDLKIIWNKPICDQEYLVNYTMQILDPPYRSYLQTVQTIADITPNRRYRICANYKIYGIYDKSAISEPFSIKYDLNANFKLIFANGSITRMLGYNAESSINKVSLGSSILLNTDRCIKYLGLTSVVSKSNKVNFSSANILNSQTTKLGLGYTKISSKYIKLDLGGVIIG